MTDPKSGILGLYIWPNESSQMAIFDAFWRAVLKIKTKSDTEKLTKFHAIRLLRNSGVLSSHINYLLS